MYVWFVVFTRSKWKMSAGRCVLLMSNHNGPGDFSEFWCSEDCKALVFYPPNRNTFLFHISLCSLAMFRPFQRGRMELVFVCLCLSCSCLYWHKCCSLREGAGLWSLSCLCQAIRQSSPLGFCALSWWPSCEKFSVTLVVPGPFKSLLVLISFPFAVCSPAGDVPLGWGQLQLDPVTWLRWHWLTPDVQVGWSCLNIDGALVGRRIKLLSLCLSCDTLGADCKYHGLPPELIWSTGRVWGKSKAASCDSPESWGGKRSMELGPTAELGFTPMLIRTRFWRNLAVQNMQDWGHCAAGFFQAEENSEKPKLWINTSHVAHFQIYRSCIN